MFFYLILITFAMKCEAKHKVEFVPLLLTDKTDIYTIRLDEEKDTEDAYLKDDLDRILIAIEKISTNGALESFFRYEGKYADRVCAVPLLITPRDKQKHGTLRLYCIRVSDNLLIVGGGGLKTTDSYDVDENLLSKVETLQAIDAQLQDLEKELIEYGTN